MGHRGHRADVERLGIRPVHRVAGAQQPPVQILRFPTHDRNAISRRSGGPLNLLGELNLSDVLVVGSSLGGWIAAKMALENGRNKIGSLVLVDSVGVDIPGQPIRDFFALDARGVAEYSYHDGNRFFVDPTTLPAEQLAARPANMELSVRPTTSASRTEWLRRQDSNLRPSG